MGRKGAFVHHSATSRTKLLPNLFKGALITIILGYAGFVLFYTSRGGGPMAAHAVGAGRGARPTIAYVISVTADGPYMDGAAVLAYGIEKASASSKYGTELIAFIHPNVTHSRIPLQRAGWRLVVKDIPVNVDEIRGDFLRERIKRNGCCGATELLKLYSWTLLEYHRVVHLDMDSLVLQSMDEIFDLDRDLVYTCDYGMMTKGSKACPVQGGFIVLKPSMDLFQQLVDVVLEGNYRDGGGWGGTNIGWFWGGMTIQGLLPYFFLHLRDPAGAAEVNRCVYNNMFDNPECKNISVPLVKNVHFTVCQKPWSCFRHGRNVRCNIFLDKWFDLRSELEVRETGTASTACNSNGRYHAMQYLKEPLEPAVDLSGKLSIN